MTTKLATQLATSRLWSSGHTSPALKMFPVLRKWGLKPRRDDQLYASRDGPRRQKDVGGDASLHGQGGGGSNRSSRGASPGGDQALSFASLYSLYHDMGVVAFDGCTYDQTQRMGSALAAVVACGGPPGLDARRCRMMKLPGKMVLPEDCPDVARDGNLVSISSFVFRVSFFVSGHITDSRMQALGADAAALAAAVSAYLHQLLSGILMEEPDYQNIKLREFASNVTLPVVPRSVLHVSQTRHYLLP